MIWPQPLVRRLTAATTLYAQSGSQRGQQPPVWRIRAQTRTPQSRHSLVANEWLVPLHPSRLREFLNQLFIDMPLGGAPIMAGRPFA